MKQITVVCVGAGNRGMIYSEVSKTDPDRIRLIGVVDTNPHHRAEMEMRHSIPKNMQFASVAEFVASGVKCDLVINATPDSVHYGISRELLLAGYNVLMEKPITPDVNELYALRDLAAKAGRHLFVCHLMRYQAFYSEIKNHILNGKIGRIVTIKMAEHVGVSHFIESFVVGKWRSEGECGSPLLLAKCCHDMDMLCWLNNSTVPTRVSSFGSRRIFIPENKPEGATETCRTCPHEDSCKYSTTNIFNGMSGAWKRIILDVGKPTGEVTQADINAQLEKSSYGRCVYEGQDLVDRQSVTVEFKDGSIGVFEVVGAVSKSDRNIHIIGEDGEIFGDRSNGYYTVRTYDYKAKEYIEEKFDVSAKMVGGHGGSDRGIMIDVADCILGERTSISMTPISDSINGHLCVYSAERSRKEGRIVNISEFSEDNN